MSEKLTVYLHFPCFDGVVSAAFASEYLARKHGTIVGEIIPVNYLEKKTWLSRHLNKPAAVVDFHYHPDADFWADHHQTTFLSPLLEQQFKKRDPQNFLFDPNASSCAEVIWRKSYRILREPRFREMVEWARRIDSARYESVEEAVLGETPAMRISLSFLHDESASYCRFLVNALREKNLSQVASSAEVDLRYRAARKATLSGQKLFRKASHLEKDNIVVFCVQNTGEKVMSRYAPYLEYPKARYSVGILETDSGAKITAMRNPWRRFKSVPLGKIFSSYGGGGHQRVASVLLKDVDEAKLALDHILQDMRRAAGTDWPG